MLRWLCETGGRRIHPDVRFLLQGETSLVGRLVLMHPDELLLSERLLFALFDVDLGLAIHITHRHVQHLALRDLSLSLKVLFFLLQKLFR